MARPIDMATGLQVNRAKKTGLLSAKCCARRETHADVHSEQSRHDHAWLDQTSLMKVFIIVFMPT